MNQQFFLTYVNALEGAMTKCKNFHWAATNLQIHEKLGDFLDKLDKYQDKIAESYMGILGQMQINVVQGSFPAVETPKEMLDVLEDKVQLFLEQLPKNAVYAGIKSETENFLLEIDSYNYLFSLAGW